MEDVAGLVAGAWPTAKVVDGPRVLSGGFWASMATVRVEGQPERVPAALVVRNAPDRAMGAKEAAVQATLASLGFLTPAVRISEPAPGGDGWWSMADFAAGRPLLAGLDGPAALRRAPQLVRDLPGQLARTMAALHRLDPEPVTDAVRAAAPEVAWTVEDVLAQFRLGAVALDRADLVAVIDELAGRSPDKDRLVVCHGDFHPFNVLVEGTEFVVLDWTGALLADPCFDVAFTELVVGNPPLVLPDPLAVVGRLAGRVLARRFVRAYRAADPTASLEHLDWYRALHRIRVLLERASLRLRHGDERMGHPFELLAPVAARDLTSATGVQVSA